MVLIAICFRVVVLTKILISRLVGKEVGDWVIIGCFGVCVADELGFVV